MSRAPTHSDFASPNQHGIVVRRRFSAEYRLRIVEEADRCREPGEIGRLLRREGLYRSHLSTWRKARRRGALQGLTPRKRGPKPATSHPLGAQVRRLEAQVARLEKELATAHTILEVQGNVAGLLGFSLRDGKDCGWPPLPSLDRSASRRPVGRWGCPGLRSTAAGGPLPGISSPVRRPPGP